MLCQIKTWAMRTFRNVVSFVAFASIFLHCHFQSLTCHPFKQVCSDGDVASCFSLVLLHSVCPESFKFTNNPFLIICPMYFKYITDSKYKCPFFSLFFSKLPRCSHYSLYDILWVIQESHISVATNLWICDRIVQHSLLYRLILRRNPEYSLVFQTKYSCYIDWAIFALFCFSSNTFYLHRYLIK